MFLREHGPLEGPSQRMGREREGIPMRALYWDLLFQIRPGRGSSIVGQSGTAHKPLITIHSLGNNCELSLRVYFHVTEKRFKARPLCAAHFPAKPSAGAAKRVHPSGSLNESVFPVLTVSPCVLEITIGLIAAIFGPPILVEKTRRSVMGRTTRERILIEYESRRVQGTLIPENVNFL